MIPGWKATIKSLELPEPLYEFRQESAARRSLKVCLKGM